MNSFATRAWRSAGMRRALWPLAALALLLAADAVNLESIPIRHQLVTAFSEASLPPPRGGSLSSSAVVMLIALVAGIALAHFTSFGADVYAIGGGRTSAALMGAPLRRRTIQIYAVGGGYSALAGVIYAFYASSGYPLAGTGNELSAIAAVVLGGRSSRAGSAWWRARCSGA